MIVTWQTLGLAATVCVLICLWVLVVHAAHTARLDRRAREFHRWLDAHRVDPDFQPDHERDLNHG